MAEPLAAIGDRTEFVRARLGPWGLVPVVEQDSSALRALAAAEALIVRAAGSPCAEKGTLVQAYWLENGGMA